MYDTVISYNELIR